MPQFCILFYANYTILATQRGGPWPNGPPPKYAPGPVPYGKSSRGNCITPIKRLDEGLRQQLLGQKPLILPVLYI